MPFVRNPQVDKWTISNWEQYIYPDPLPEELIVLRRIWAEISMKNWEDLISYQDECAPCPTHHAEDCSDSFCDGYKCWKNVLMKPLKKALDQGSLGVKDLTCHSMTKFG